LGFFHSFRAHSPPSPHDEISAGQHFSQSAFFAEMVAKGKKLL
jgi:hypothetical protein